MTTTVGAAQGRCDVLVVVGITGDLARVMTFRSLYRLEARGLLHCPVVGVAADDWTVEQLVHQARESIEATGEQLDPDVFDRLAARLSYVGGDLTDEATYARVRDAVGGFGTPVFYLEIPPFLFGTVVKGLAAAGLTAASTVPHLTRSSSGWGRRPACGSSSRPGARPLSCRRRSSSTWSSPPRAGRVRLRTRCCCTRRWQARARASCGRTASRRPGA